MVSAPATYWISDHSRPASPSAARAALTPYSTKLRPHLPHGCMPTPRIATCRFASGTRRPPFPDQVLVLVVLVEGPERQLHLGAHAEGADIGAGHELAKHDHALVGELDGGDGVGLERVGRDVRRRGLVAVVRERPHAAGAAQRYLLELAVAAAGVATGRGLREEAGAARRAPAAEQPGPVLVHGEPAFDDRHP